MKSNVGKSGIVLLLAANLCVKEREREIGWKEKFSQIRENRN